MVTYPIHVPRSPYRGRNPAKLRKRQEHNRLAQILEEHLNEQIAQDDSEFQTYHYAFIALDLNLSEDKVRQVLFAVGGHNGLTVRKPRQSDRGSSE